MTKNIERIGNNCRPRAHTCKSLCRPHPNIPLFQNQVWNVRRTRSGGKAAKQKSTTRPSSTSTLNFSSQTCPRRFQRNRGGIAICKRLLNPYRCNTLTRFLEPQMSRIGTERTREGWATRIPIRSIRSIDFRPVGLGSTRTRTWRQNSCDLCT